MRQRQTYAINEKPRLMDTDTLRTYLNLGRDNAVRLGNASGARLQFGKRVLWDKNKVDAYLDSLTED